LILEFRFIYDGIANVNGKFFTYTMYALCMLHLCFIYGVSIHEI